MAGIHFTERKLFTVFAEVDSIMKSRPSNKEYFAKIDSVLPSSFTTVTSNPNIDSLRTCIRKYIRQKNKKKSIKDIVDNGSTEIAFSCWDVQSSIVDDDEMEVVQDIIPLDEKPPTKKNTWL